MCAILGFLTEFVCFETATGQLADNGRQVRLLGSFRLRPQRVSWLNGRQGTLLGLFVLRPRQVSWLIMAAKQPLDLVSLF